VTVVNATPYAADLSLNLEDIGVRLGVDFRRLPFFTAMSWRNRESLYARPIFAKLAPEEQDAFEVVLRRLLHAFNERTLPWFSIRA
jgi:hypothetical protein